MSGHDRGDTTALDHHDLEMIECDPSALWRIERLGGGNWWDRGGG